MTDSATIVSPIKTLRGITPSLQIDFSSDFKLVELKRWTKDMLRTCFETFQALGTLELEA